VQQSPGRLDCDVHFWTCYRQPIPDVPEHQSTDAVITQVDKARAQLPCDSKTSDHPLKEIAGSGEPALGINQCPYHLG
jgi:hypothetical protein